MNIASKFAAMGLGLAVVVAGASSANAWTRWQQHHPRRVEVNYRLANQNRRIRTEVREGELTHAQAAELHAQDRGIRAQERFDASQHGSHITKAEQRQLNQEENTVSHEIGR